MSHDSPTREALVAAARDRGVERPEVMTRSELERALRVGHAAIEAEAPRSWLGIARDLIASVVEQGLHLPDAARMIRALPAPPSRRRAPPTPLATVTLAEIFAAQGHPARALEVLDGVLAAEPGHATALALRARLLAARPSRPPAVVVLPEAAPAPGAAQPEAPTAVAAPAREAPPSVPEAPVGAPPAAIAAAAPAARSAAVVPTQPSTASPASAASSPASPATPTAPAARVELSTTPEGWRVRWACSQARPAPGAQLVLRVVEFAPSWGGARATLLDHRLEGTQGVIEGRCSDRAEVRFALGWRDDRAFRPLALPRA